MIDAANMNFRKGVDSAHYEIDCGYRVVALPLRMAEVNFDSGFTRVRDL